MTTTIARPADRLRAALEAAGFNPRRVSTLRITIHDASVSLTQVDAITGPFEYVRRCEATYWGTNATWLAGTTCSWTRANLWRRSSRRSTPPNRSQRRHER
jgi:hypothetical protein